MGIGRPWLSPLVCERRVLRRYLRIDLRQRLQAGASAGRAAIAAEEPPGARRADAVAELWPRRLFRRRPGLAVRRTNDLRREVHATGRVCHAAPGALARHRQPDWLDEPGDAIRRRPVAAA